eukprot:639351-Alexandrium_andersonii.AAC.1
MRPKAAETCRVALARACPPGAAGFVELQTCFWKAVALLLRRCFCRSGAGHRWARRQHAWQTF